MSRTSREIEEAIIRWQLDTNVDYLLDRWQLRLFLSRKEILEVITEWAKEWVKAHEPEPQIKVILKWGPPQSIPKGSK